MSEKLLTTQNDDAAMLRQFDLVTSVIADGMLSAAVAALLALMNDLPAARQRRVIVGALIRWLDAAGYDQADYLADLAADLLAAA